MPPLRTNQPRRRPQRTVLIFSQVFVPDPASVGQHLYDVAREMVRRGYRVRVYTARHGYDDPTRVYPARENLDGIEVRRLPLASFGKSTIFTRALGTLSFQIQAMFRGIATGSLAGVFFSTSPPLIGFAATVIRMFRTVPIAYWAMDLNPDQLIAIKRLTPHSPIAAFLESANRMILRNAAFVIVLDRFMAKRLSKRGRINKDVSDKLEIIPPWPHETFIESVPHATNPFRKQHGLDGKFIVMYSGNHSASNPLLTVLQAAERLRDDPEIRFCFVGGGTMKKDLISWVQTRGLPNIICLPYQPLESLQYSLSAADVHVVSLGENMVGIIHPCKVYGAMAVGRPILYVGPTTSHVGDLLLDQPIGLHVRHGDVDGAVAAIRQLQAKSEEERAAMGHAAQQKLAADLSEKQLCGRLCDGLQRVFR